MTSGERAEDTYDIVVVGSGGGGLIGAYIAASRGLRTLLVEKTDRVGGTTSYSGAGLWFPGSAPIERAGVPDDVETARTYLRSVVDDESREGLQDAYLDAGPRLVDELERNPWFQSFRHDPVPDYFAANPGSSPMGRTIFPPEIAADVLGEHAAIVRPCIPEERWGQAEGPVLHGGRALIGRALGAFLETGNGALRLETALHRLVVEDGRVTGVTAIHDGAETTIRATRGVLLAAGGFERNAALRAKYQPIALTGEWSNGAPANTGDALLAGIDAGATTDLLDEAWYVPGLVQPDGLPVFQSGLRGGIWVNADGERFVNEARPYDQAGHEIAARHVATGVPHIPAHWILDQRQIDRDGFGGPPDQPVDPAWFSSGALRRADSLDELATLIGVPPDALRATVEKFNSDAEVGVDTRFHRGETPWDQIFHHVVPFPFRPEMNCPASPTPDFPNPLLLPLDSPPFYVAEIVLSDIGTKGGLKIDERARVLRADGGPIAGLYATGNTAAAMSGRAYPGAGTPIGSSLAFGYLAVLDAAGAAG
ncbi:FAD-binding protein [Saccharopolyspora sp. HNM0983]|uniref:3-oxosteroid 1-dehydrogenase n=1 Tax=Saccharopolyspora montiporae TaxID=2781240 RepID=A0A929B8T6_9PSEU|nr:FAD-dependent oxidoreductase [Saccharopolyspora sp. HNM0983]MBE9373293.1 FAD-binding protein [Saccharopolyspora sp. HNM0983]